MSKARTGELMSEAITMRRCVPWARTPARDDEKQFHEEVSHGAYDAIERDDPLEAQTG